MISKDQEWRINSADVFWGEIAPCQHLLQVYDNESVFIATLEGFIKSGFEAGDSVVVIATAEHLQTLRYRLTFLRYDLDKLISEKSYIPLDANEALGEFMRGDWPEESLFRRFVTATINEASEGGRNVRAFGEMVAVLWTQGKSGATVRLEHLWEKYLHEEPINLFCAYPKSGFTQDAHVSLQEICASHSLIISGEAKPTSEIFYHNSPLYVKRAR